MMAQYVEIKAAHPDALLFYRMGDFYELFFDDAEIAAEALAITLTKRGKHNGEDIPMCGVPVHAADDYLQKLIAGGHRVAVCEQLEDPLEAKKRGSKAVVKRDVVRLVTPGTLTEENLLDAGSNNFLASLSHVKADGDHGYALSWVDLSTGLFRVLATQLSTLEADLARIAPAELIVSDRALSDDMLRALLEHASPAVVSQPSAFFDSMSAGDRICRYFNVASPDAFGAFSRAEMAAIAAILAYVEKTQIGERPELNAPAREDAGGFMAIDPATRTNLELTRTLSGERKGSLLDTVKMTVTGAGTRLLAERLASPSLDLAAINARLDAVSWFKSDRRLREEVRLLLKSVPDIARSLARLSLSRGGPRDLAAIGEGIGAALVIGGRLAQHGEAREQEVSSVLVDEQAAVLLKGPGELAEMLSSALLDDLPRLKRDGGFVRDGYIEALDEARALRDESRKVIAGLQADYAELSGVKALKIKHNNVLGYFIEVSAQHGERLMSAPLNDTFIHRQTLANAVRFTTSELSELQSGIVNAASRALALELETYDRLEDAVVAEAGTIKDLADALAEIDLASANAELAEVRSYSRPELSTDIRFEITGGRHPVVERALEKALSDPFVANSCRLSGDDGQGQICLITGPNMAGKSTFLRQNALIAVMAQAGMFVPAEKASIGLVDRLFSRVGASDDLARGRSTFMVEMVETAAILNQAGPRALVILDEIGRGTATFDGLSIAWAAIEHLHEVNQCRALFATHYHELTALSEKLQRLFNATVKVSEWKGDVVFLHEIVAGAADRSYGIQVARLAGLPDAVIARAKEVLAKLEATERENPAALIDDLPLFNVAMSSRTAPSQHAPDERETQVLDTLATINPDDLTPREALEVLYKLKRDAQ
ncbi:MAG: DNA mismatch repair protein MutS [Pseudomonadota bacterium]